MANPRLRSFALEDALRIADLPIGHYQLARAALDAKLYAQAYTELQTCIEKRTQLLLPPDEVTTYRLLPLLHYYMAKAQEGLGSTDAAASYEAFLAMQYDPDPTDPLVADAKAHLK